MHVVKKNSPEYNSPDLLKVGKWLYNHQSNYQPIFNESQKQLLREVGYVLQEDKLTPEEEFNKTFNYYYGLLVKINEQNESGICEVYSTNLASTDKIKVDLEGIVHVVKKNSQECNSPDLLDVGQWLYSHQNKYQPFFDENQKKLLREVGYVLQEEKLNIEKEKFNKIFNEHYSLLVKIKEQKESGVYEEYSTNLSASDKIKVDSEGIVHVVKISSPEYKSPDLLNTGDWLWRRQLDFDENQKQKLREVGYVLQEDNLTPEEELNKKFNYYYGLLVKIKEQNESGICEEYSTNLTNKDKIKVDSEGIVHVVKYDSPEYKSPDLLDVGQWLYKRQPDGDSTQKQMLRDIGYVQPGEEFNSYYYYLEKIKEQNKSGICKDSTNLTSDDKIKVDSKGIVHVVKKSSPEYKSADLLKVGQWLYNHQNNVKPVFDENQKQMLREVGYVLQEDKKKKFDESKKKVDSLHHDNVVDMVESKKEVINANRIS